MNRQTIAFALLLAVGDPTAATSQPAAYALFDAEGRPAAYADMIADLARQDVVFFGETHNDPMCHWLELEVLRSLHREWGARMSLGMEMFETDVQLIIDERERGLIAAKNFDDEARPWPNHETDYARTVDYAMENHIHLVATNVPRRYAAAVRRNGLQILDSLSTEARRFLPPLPIAYEANPEAEAGFQMMAALGRGAPADSERLGQSQGLKDATMAWFVSRRTTPKMLHINGNIHTAAGDGIVKYLKHYAPSTRVKTIYSARQEHLDTLEEVFLGQADYYVVVPETMVTSY